MGDVESWKMSREGINEGEQGHKGIKRKKKRSSMQMAKKYCRRSERQHELDSETYHYLANVLDELRQDFPTVDEKIAYVSSKYGGITDHVLEYARNQIGSRVLESMIEYATCQVVENLADAFGESLRPICSDRFASHVLEKVIHICAVRATEKLQTTTEPSAQTKETSVAVDDCDIPKYNNIALKLCRYMINNFEEFVWDTYANRVLRTAIESLGGVLEKESDSAKRREYSNFTHRRSVPQEYTDLLVDIANRFLSWPQFPELVTNELTSGLLQTLLWTLKGLDSKLDASIMERIVEECFSENTNQQLSSVFHAESSARLLEVCLRLSKPNMFMRIYKKFFAQRLRELSLMSGANFSVQRLMDYCNSKEIMEEIFEELSGDFVAILDRKNTGIFASMANACMRLQCKQGSFVNSISEMLGCNAANSDAGQLEIVPVVSTLEKYDKVMESRKTNGSKVLPVHLHGSIVLQAMFRFNKPIKIVNSLLAMNGEELSALLSDPKGSRILDAFMESKFIGEKSREKLTKKLEGNWAKLACGIHGSRCLDKIWQWSKSTQRYRIMDELAEVGESLNSTKAGRIIFTKLKVSLYARNKKVWTVAQTKEEKTKAVFASIVDAK